MLGRQGARDHYRNPLDCHTGLPEDVLPRIWGSGARGLSSLRAAEAGEGWIDPPPMAAISISAFSGGRITSLEPPS
jgi:hypothetical protein